MENIVSLVLSVENVRVLVLLAFGVCGFVWNKNSFSTKIDGVEKSLNVKIDGMEKSLNAKIDGVERSLNAKIDGVERSLNTKIDGVEKSLLKAMDDKIASANTSLYNQLKTNDFKHLNDTVEELTFMLEKNGYLSPEDKKHIDGRLDK